MIASPNSVTVDLSALGRNLRQVRNLVSRDTRIMGVVKSDAYGHGLLEIGRALERDGIDCLGVAYLHEALDLREGGVRLPIVILCGIRTREESRQVLEKGLTPVLYDPTVAEILSQECQRQGRKARIHVKVDTGMGRLGISDNDIGPFLQEIISLKSLEVEALTSHLATADESGSRFSEDQIRRFEQAIFTGRSLGLRMTLNNMANSAGDMRHKGTHFDKVRPGIMLYGGLPSPDFNSPVPLAPVMHLKAQVVQVRNLPDKTPVSYGRTYYTEGPRRIAVISAGYSDGLPRRLSNRGHVLVGGGKVDIIGTICMNLTVCDISGHKDIKPGDEAVVLGSQGEECIKGDDIARVAGSISYEIFCAIGRKRIRKYVS
ncbi:MAG: alanine racemase [Deltaproteobacteria bacterium]|nr:alanine racemase [Deltaproteobacteria bacterium]